MLKRFPGSAVLAATILLIATAAGADAGAPAKACSELLADYAGRDMVLTWGQLVSRSFQGRSCDDNGDDVVGPASVHPWELRLTGVDSLAQLEWASWVQPDAAVHSLYPEEPAELDGIANSPVYELFLDARKLSVGHTYAVDVAHFGECETGDGCDVVTWDGSVTVTPIPVYNLSAISTDGTSASVELHWSRTAAADSFSLDRLALVRGDGVPITHENLHEGTVLTDDLPEHVTSQLDQTGSPGHDYYYTVFGHRQDGGLVLQSNAASVLLSTPVYRELVLFDDFADRDFATCPGWVDASLPASEVLVHDEGGDAELRFHSDWGESGAFLEAPVDLGGEDFSISYDARAGGAFWSGFYLVDDSGKDAFWFRCCPSYARLSALNYDLNGDEISPPTDIIDYGEDLGDIDNRFEIRRIGQLYELHIDGLKAAGGNYDAGDAWHDDITGLRLWGGDEAGSANDVYVDDVRVAGAGTGAPFAGALDIDAVVLNGEILDPLAPEILVLPGYPLSGSVDVSIRSAKALEDRVLAATPNWGERRDAGWLAACAMPDDQSTTIDIDLYAPVAPRWYDLILVAGEEGGFRHLLSATSCLENVAPVWEDGDDLFDWPDETIQAAIETGSVTVPYRDGIDGVAELGARVIRVKVECVGAQLVGDLPGDIDPGDRTVDVAVGNGLVCLAAHEAGLKVADVSNPLEPVLLDVLDTPGEARSVCLTGNLALVADGSAGLRLVDVSTPSALLEVGSYDTPGDARGVCSDGTRAYVADGATGILVIDITTPSVPVLAGTYDTPGDALALALDGVHLHVADGPGGLHVVDVSEPSSPLFAGQASAFGELTGVDATGGLAYTTDDSFGLVVFDVADPTDPGLLTSVPTSGTASGLDATDEILVLADESDGLLVFDVTDPDDPEILATVGTPGEAQACVLAGSFIYIADYEGLQVSSMVCLDGTTGVDGDGGPAARRILGLRAHPTPFNPSTTITYVLGRAGEVDLSIYDLKGRLVRTLADGYRDAGTHARVWNGRDDVGGIVPSGVYFAHLRSGGHATTEKVTLLK